ncbi:DnaA ATPase domain-containing protein [Bacillus sp. S/N-304-OC-R1]|uniref:DnaA ATPase domain-containing protein n=1 Tax=Bacillus sp. S/N-304-OC-R1 TaxID=2758034 RepID=UPI0028BE2E1F|nr:DnaA/Hda family protein [Bacillus sp. S/N-304-OC-R1]
MTFSHLFGYEQIQEELFHIINHLFEKSKQIEFSERLFSERRKEIGVHLRVCLELGLVVHISLDGKPH